MTPLKTQMLKDAGSNDVVRQKTACHLLTQFSEHLDLGQNDLKLGQSDLDDPDLSLLT